MLKNVIDLLHNEYFDLDLFRSKIKTLKSCIAYANSKIGEEVSTLGFSKEKVYHFSSEKQYMSEYYSKDIIKALKKQIGLASESDIIWNPTKSRSISITGSSNCTKLELNTHPLHLNHFGEIHTERKKQIMMSNEMDILWYDEETKKSFVGFLQVFTDKTVTTLKVGAVSAHVVHATFLNFTKSFRKKMIQDGKTIIGLLPTGTTDECTVNGIVRDTNWEKKINHQVIEKLYIDQNNEESGTVVNETRDDSEIVALLDKITLTSTGIGRSVKMGLIHNAMTKLLQPVLDVTLRGFEIPWNSCTFTCFPMLMSYCCDIPEAKDMSACLHNITTKCPCHRCMVKLSDICNLSTGRQRHYVDTSNIRNEVYRTMQNHAKNKSENVAELKGKEYEHCKMVLKNNSISPFPSFLEGILNKYPSFLPKSLYEIFTYEPLHNLHLGISKLLKNLTYELTGSQKLVKFTNSKKNKVTKFSSQRTAILRACNSILRAIQEDCGSSGIHIDFSTKETSSNLNGIFLETGVRGMLEGKDYRNLDYFFPFVAAFVDRISGCTEGSLTLVHTLYSKLLHELLVEVEYEGISTIQLKKIQCLINLLKRESKKLFEPYVQKGLFTLKFHLLDHLVEDLSKYGSLQYLDSGPYEYFNSVLKRFYRETSRRKGTALEETLQTMSNASAETGTVSKKKVNNTTTQYLVRNGLDVSLREVKSLQTSQCSEKVANVGREILSALPSSDLPVLIGLIEEHLVDQEKTLLDCDVQLTVVKSGYIDAFKTPTLSSFDYKSKKVIFSSDAISPKSKKRVFATSSFGPVNKKIHSTIFVKGTYDEHRDEFWFAKLLLLFRLSCPEKGYTEELALVRYYKCIEPLDKMDEILDCICLRWETEDEEDYSAKALLDNDVIVAGEQYGLISFQTICGTCEVVRSNYAIPEFQKELPWTHHKFYVNRFVQ